MFKVTLLSTEDKKQWLEILDGFELKDPHYLPGYLQVYENLSVREPFMHFGGQGILFVYGDTRNFIIYPFFKRSISDLPFADNSVKDLYDIVSPYGYGGPLGQVEDEAISEELWRGFFDEFGTFCRQNNIVSEFSRLHPMFDNARFVSEFSDGHAEKKSRIVYVDLTGSEEDIVAQMSRQRRAGLCKAKQNPKLHLFVSSEPEYAPFFSALYETTMLRKNANARFQFGSNFLELTFRVLRNHITLCYVAYDSEPIAAVLALNYGGLCYDWLSCSKHECLHLYPNDLCIYQSVVEARKKGCKFLILGGGVSGEDSLFRFKAEFSRSFKDFYVYKKIHLENEYSEIVRLRNRYSNEPTGNFFPEYRSYRVEETETTR